MWCTRWFLPLLLLPLPTAPPYFLVLFILSLTMHAKPCFYCIVLLTTLFVSSCYWQPFPVDTPLTTPWSENITTFKEALNASLPSNYTRPLPSVMRAADRCWCDLTGSFFEPFNVSRWEYISVRRVSRELLRQEKEETKAVESLEGRNTTISNATSGRTDVESNFWTRFSPFHRQHIEERKKDDLQLPSIPRTPAPEPSQRPLVTTASTAGGVSPTELSLLRTEYDLRQYGLDVILDFGWSR